MTSQLPRRSHAYLDVHHRRRKAEKIARIAETRVNLEGLSVLEIGGGSGVIASYFSERVGPGGSVTAVDVVDERVVTEGYDFVPVDGVALPFPDDSFDLVITNHVIEHVGDTDRQLIHLREIARVLRPSAGTGYLAVPNRWALREPHFRLWFLSWFPGSLRDRYVRAAGKGSFYDCDPPGPISIRRLMKSAGMKYQDVTEAALRLLLELEKGPMSALLARNTPKIIRKLISPICPTMVSLLSSSAPASASGTGSES